MRGARSLVLVVAIATGMLLAANRRAGAGNPEPDVAAFNERCANRLSIAIVGKGATAEQLAAADPRAAIDGLINSGDFRERFARFINQEFNEAPGALTSSAFLEDAPYHLTKVVLESGKPWSDLFLGPYNIVSTFSEAQVKNDANGLGYFRVPAWYLRYEGNEPNKIKIATAYRIMNNVVGLHLTASTGNPDTDQTATGRQAQPCAGCHYDKWYALDKVASVLSLKGEGYAAYKAGPKEMFGGQMISNDKEMVTALVKSENFSVNACRLAFKYLYGREDNRCEGPLLDQCVETFKAKQTMQSALSLIANDKTFCE